MYSTEAMLGRLGAALTVVRHPCKTIKDVQRLCDHVSPCWSSLSQTGPQLSSSLECRPELLSLMVQLQIPANLLQFMALVLRAAYPSTPLQGSARATSLCAAEAWSTAADVMSNMLAACREQQHKTDAYRVTCKAIMAQLQTPGSLEPPGTAMHLKSYSLMRCLAGYICLPACKACASHHCGD